MSLDAFDVAWEEFLLTFDGERNLPGAERGKAALRAAFRALAPDQITAKRAEDLVESIAAKHGTTAAAVRDQSIRTAVMQVAREETAFELARMGLSQRRVAQLLGLKAHEPVQRWIRSHEARVAAEATERKEIGNVG